MGTLLTILEDEKELNELIEFFASQNEGEISDDLQEKESELLRMKSLKIDNYCNLIDSLKSKEELYKKQKDIFASKEKAVKNIIDKMKSFLKDTLIHLDEKSFIGIFRKVTLVNPKEKKKVVYNIEIQSKSFNICDTSKIHPRYLKQVTVLDTELIKNDLGGGLELEIAYLDYNESYIKIS